MDTRREASLTMIRVEPVLYERIEIHAVAQQERIARSIEHHPAKPTDFFAVRVKDLSLTYWNLGYASNIDTSTTIVEACKSVLRLAIRIKSEEPEDEQNVGRLCKLLKNSTAAQSRLTIPLTFCPTDKATLRHPIFQNVSHLEIEWVTIPQEDWVTPHQWDWPPLSDLQRLTHVCIRLGQWGAGRHIAAAATLPSWLQVFMVFVRWSARNIKQMEEYVLSCTELDMRVVMCTHESAWGSHAAGSWLKRNAVPKAPGNNALNEDFWSEAESLIRRRREGLVEVCLCVTFCSAGHQIRRWEISKSRRNASTRTDE